MIQFLAKTQAGCRRSFPRRLLHRITTLAISACAALIPQTLYTKSLKAESSDRPNIVLILADDLGYGDVKCFGRDRCQIDTPHFDRLATEGMRFTDAHANASVCVPTRVAIMTGQYPWRLPKVDRSGKWGFLGPQFPATQHTLGKMMKSAGYQTGYVGKWHLGTTMQTTDGKVQGPSNVDYTKPLIVGPKDHGFNDSFILPGSLDMFPYAFVRNHHWVGNVAAQKGWSAFNRVGPAAEDFEDTKVLSTFSSEAERFIADAAEGSRNGNPFFLFFALTSPHTPTSPSKDFQGKSKLGLYGDFVMETDHCVGRVLNALDKHSLTENTLVIATSDHGPAAYAGRIAEATRGQLRHLEKDGHYSGGPYRGYKFSVYEGGLRVPFVARWPGTVNEKTTCDQLVGLPDMMATFAEVAGVELENDQAADSFSIVPLLKQPDSSGARQTMILEGTRAMAFRIGKDKLAFCPGSGCVGHHGNSPQTAKAWSKAVNQYGKKPKNHQELVRAPFVQLFSLESDPHEDNNLAAGEGEKIKAMYAALKLQIASGRTRPGTPTASAGKDIKIMRPPPFVWDGPEKADPAVSIKQTDDAIIATYNDKIMLRYNIAIQKAPEGISQGFQRSGYIHPINTPSGLPVTGDFPKDHPHQHALFNAWTDTTFENRKVDFWNQKKKLGRVSHQKVVDVGQDHFTISLAHEDLTGPNGPKTVLEETWTVKLRGQQDNSYVFDITSVQTCVADTALKINQYHYGGMGIRGNNQWHNESSAIALKKYQQSLKKKDAKLEFPSLQTVRHRFKTSEGKQRFEGNHSRPNWVDLSGLIDEKIAGVTVMGHPSNFRFPQNVRLHPSKPYFCFAPMVIGDFEIKPGEKYESRFRYIVHDGDVPSKTIQKTWQDFRIR